jgi:nucleolar complex protein 3
VLYFSILKSPTPLNRGAGLLHAALEGVSKFAHLVNIDFFGDLLEVLKDIAGKCKSRLGLAPDPFAKEAVPTGEYYLQHQDRREVIKLVKLELRCILTAFELLTGQGKQMLRSSYQCLSCAFGPDDPSFLT